MKKILTTLVFTFATLVAVAQEDLSSPGIPAPDSLNRIIATLEKCGIGHFKFKDISIDGPIKPFVAQLKKQGFTVLKTTEVDAILSGKFTDEDVHLLVQATPKNVYGVTVSYSKQSTWKAIKTQYENMKSMLVAKYGEPKEIIEKFDSPNSEKYGLELYALRNDKCTYMALFGTENGNGMIRIKIGPDASLVITYIDSINYLRLTGRNYNDL